jgi:hypothetical protein
MEHVNVVIIGAGMHYLVELFLPLPPTSSQSLPWVLHTDNY